MNKNNNDSTKSYVYTRRGATSIIDATAWGRGVKYHGAVYTRRDVAMILQLLLGVSLAISMTRSIGCGAMSLSGAIKWVQETFQAARHYDAYGKPMGS